MKSGSEYIVKEALLDAERDFSKPNPYGTPVDIYGMIAEVSIHESLLKPYLTVNIVIIDSQDVISSIVNLQGTEKLKLTMSTNFGEDDLEKEFTLNLRLVSIVAENKVNDYAQSYHINCISEYAYDNANVQISRSYKGQLEDIAENILDDYLSVGVDRDEQYWEGETIQGRLKLIVPYLSPLETVSWLSERGCKYDAAPVYMWSTVWNSGDEPKVNLGDLSTMSVQGALKVKPDLKVKGPEQNRSFVYYQSSPNSQDIVTSKANKGIIKEIGSTSSSSDTLKMINRGMIGSRLSSLDTYTTQKIDRHFNVEEFLDFYRSNVGLSAKSEQNLPKRFDEQDLVTVQGQKKSPAELDARHRNLVTSYGTYEWENSYHDVPDPTEAMNKVRKGVLRSMINKDTIDVTLPGHNFMTEEMGSGDVIRLTIPRTFTDDEAADLKSAQGSGFYLILALRHVFIGNTHSVVATCGKIQDDPE